MVKYKVQKSDNPYKNKDLKEIRKMGHKLQDGFCPILKKVIPVEDMVVDHCHKGNAKNLGTTDAGLIRGVIQRQVNVIEGKITNSFIRYGLHKQEITLPEFLRNLADYLENPPLIKYMIVHPSEKQKPLKLSKNSFKRVQKEFKAKYPKKKIITYPKSCKLTKTLEILFKEFNIEPEFLKGK